MLKMKLLRRRNNMILLGFDNREHIFQEFQYLNYDRNLGDFVKDGKKLDNGQTILLASYYFGENDGDAFVLYKDSGKLYEVNASHCSCYGLEGQWNPEEVLKEELLHRLNNGRLGVSYSDENIFAKELHNILKSL